MHKQNTKGQNNVPSSKKKGKEEVAQVIRRTLRSQNGKSGDKTKRQLPCHQCGEMFSSKTSFKRHIATEHKANNTSNTVEKPGSEIRSSRGRGRPRKIIEDVIDLDRSIKEKKGDLKPSSVVEEASETTELREDKPEDRFKRKFENSTPVTCATCRNTYRSKAGYENHFSGCIPYSSSSSSEDEQEEEMLYTFEDDEIKRRPEYEEDVIISDDECSIQTIQDEHIPDDSYHHKSDSLIISPTLENQHSKGCESIYSEETISVKTNSPSTVCAPSTSASPTAPFSHSFSISSLVSKKDPPLRSPEPPQPVVNSVIASIERFFTSASSRENSESSINNCSSVLPKHATSSTDNSSLDVEKKKTDTSSSASKSTQMSTESFKPIAKSELPAAAIHVHGYDTAKPSHHSNNNLSQDVYPKESSRSVVTTAKVSPVQVHRPRPFKSPPAITPTLDNLEGLAAAFVKKQTPIDIISPKASKPDTSNLLSPNRLPTQHLPSSSYPGYNNNNNSIGADTASYYPTAQSFHPPTPTPTPAPLQHSPSLRNTSTETITIQDSSGQIMRVQMPTVPSVSQQQLSNYFSQQGFNNNYSNYQQGYNSYSWPYQLHDQQQQYSYQQQLHASRYQQQPLPFQMQSQQLLLQPKQSDLYHQQQQLMQIQQLTLQQQQQQQLLQMHQQQQQQQQIFQNHPAIIQQHNSPYINSHSVLNYPTQQQHYFQPHLQSATASHSNHIPWQTSSSLQQPPLALAPASLSSTTTYGISQDSHRSDNTYLVLQPHQTYPAISVPTAPIQAPQPQVYPSPVVINSYNPNMYTAPQQHNSVFSSSAIPTQGPTVVTPSSLLPTPPLSNHSSAKSTPPLSSEKSPSNNNNNKVHTPGGHGLAHPCSCEMCKTKINKKPSAELKIIKGNKIQQQFYNPTWSSLSSSIIVKPEPNGVVKQEQNRFKKILPAGPLQPPSLPPPPVQPSSTSETVPLNYDKGEVERHNKYLETLKNNANGGGIPAVAVVRPLENPLQKLSDQISQIGQFSQVPQISPALAHGAKDYHHHQYVNTSSVPRDVVPNGLASPNRPYGASTNKIINPEQKLMDLNNKLQSRNLKEGLPNCTNNNNSSSRKRSIGPEQKSSEDQPKPKRKYNKRTIPQDQEEDCVRLTLKRKDGETLYAVKRKKPALCENERKMKSLKVRAKVTNSEGKANTCMEVVIHPTVHVIPVPSEDSGHRTVREDEEADGRSTGMALVQTEGSDEAIDVVDKNKIMTHRAVILYEVMHRGSLVLRSCDVRGIWSFVIQFVHGVNIGQMLTPVSFPPVHLSLPHNKLGPTFDYDKLGLVHPAIDFLLKESPSKKPKSKATVKPKKSAAKKTIVRPESPSTETLNGCARFEGFQERKVFDMFGWLASKHRNLPCIESIEVGKSGTPISLPHMRYKHMKEKSPKLLGVFYSTIHGRGLFTRRDIQKGDMVIEYAGEVIRAVLCDYREKLYESKGYGCYMFKIDEIEVVDATMRGNAARFINHSCDPNCKSKVVEIHGKSRILIFALRKILGGEELTYDYHFSKEHKDKKIPCTCGATRCRKFLN